MGRFESALRFDGDRDFDVEMTTVSVSGAWLVDERRTVRAGAGVILDGVLEAGGVRYEADPGGLAFLGAEYRTAAGGGRSPAVDLSLFLGASWTRTVAPGLSGKTRYFASDARFGVRAGWTAPGESFVYLAARVFGGPVKWKLADQDVTGTDTHHYQLAAGAAKRIGRAGIYLEFAPVGERAMSAGASMDW